MFNASSRQLKMSVRVSCKCLSVTLLPPCCCCCCCLNCLLPLLLPLLLPPDDTPVSICTSPTGLSCFTGVRMRKRSNSASSSSLSGSSLEAPT